MRILMQFGYNAITAIMDLLVRAGALRKSGHQYFYVKDL